MPLDTYAALKASALSWIERTGDPAAENIISDCVTLCEARVNKVPNFRLSNMETEATLTVVDGSADLPADFLAMHRVTANYSVPRVLTYAEPGWYAKAYPFPMPGEEGGFYTIVGSTLRAHADVDIVYYAAVPPLATTDPNWLIGQGP